MRINILSKFPPYFSFFIGFVAVQLIVFLCYRIIHAVYNHNSLEIVSGELMYSALLRGAQFDVSVISYVNAILFLVLCIASFVPLSNKLIHIVFWLVLPFILLTQFVFTVSIPYYHQFGNHLNKQVFLWQNENEYMLGLIFANFAYWGFIIPFIISAFITIRLSKKFLSQYLKSNQRVGLSWQNMSLVFVGCLLLFLGMRGRVSFKTPLHEGIGIISNSNYINSLAINPNYTFWKNSFFESDESYSPPANIKELILQTQNNFGFVDSTLSFTRNENPDRVPQKRNIVLVIMESMCLFKMGYYGGEKTYPLFDSIVKESVFFDHFFSSGIHTFNGVFSSLTGFPSVYDEQPLIKYTKKPFNCTSTILKTNGYTTHFYTTHDKFFDNMAGFLKLNAFDEVFGDEIYNGNKNLSNLGVPDHVLFNEFIKRTNERSSQSPFFSVILTSSDHGPWKVPDDIPFKQSSKKEEQAAAQYADWSIYSFLQNAKKQNWYANTIFMFLGDNGLSLGHTYQMPLSYHHIPFVIHCPSLLQPDTVCSPSYQPDIQATTLGLVGVHYSNSTFGIDLFKKTQRPFVFFTADDKVGAITPKEEYFFTINKSLQKYFYRQYQSLNGTNLYDANKPYCDSLNHKIHCALESAKFLIRQNYYAY